jgi:hypothetical protein
MKPIDAMPSSKERMVFRAAPAVVFSLFIPLGGFVFGAEDAQPHETWRGDSCPHFPA